MNMMWIIAVIVFAVIEAITVSTVAVWFVGGALAAFVAQLLGAALWLQIVVFFVTSIILLLSLFPVARKFAKNRNVVPTNLDMLIGKEALLTEEVNNLQGTGALKIEGKEWSARGVCEGTLAEGTRVKIVRMEGVRLLVEPADATACKQ